MRPKIFCERHTTLKYSKDCPAVNNLARSKIFKVRQWKSLNFFFDIDSHIITSDYLRSSLDDQRTCWDLRQKFTYVMKYYNGILFFSRFTILEYLENPCAYKIRKPAQIWTILGSIIIRGSGALHWLVMTKYCTLGIISYVRNWNTHNHAEGGVLSVKLSLDLEWFRYCF